ncbi:hypothetical protein ACU4GA_29110 [Methylobacterium oryzae CBMB20]
MPTPIPTSITVGPHVGPHVDPRLGLDRVRGVGLRRSGHGRTDPRRLLPAKAGAPEAAGADPVSAGMAAAPAAVGCG